MKILSVTVLLAVVLAWRGYEAHAAHASSLGELRAREHRVVHKVERAKTTIRWFEHRYHGKTIQWLTKHPSALRAVNFARQRVILGRAELVRIRALIAKQWSPVRLSPQQAIRFVFGRYADQAIRVSSCETGGTFSVYAQNGQYLGLFQMGEYARSTYGHSWTPLGQAKAAYRYFVDSGRDWSPWSCKPW